MSEAVKSGMSKADVDQKLWREALRLDQAICAAPLRSVDAAREVPVIMPEQSLIAPAIRFDALQLLPATFVHRDRNKAAFVPLPDGSNRTFAALQALADQNSLPFDRAMNFLHRKGTEHYLDEMLSPLSIVRLVQNGVLPSTIPGCYRRLSSGFEYGVFNSSHPDLIEAEMDALGKKADQMTAQISKCNTIDVNVDDVRRKLAEVRFCTAEQVEGYTDKELLALLGASETQRIMAYIHPWYERIGRTTEEGRALFALRCGVDPVLLSTSENRSTLAGYERGVSIGVTAIGVLREMGRNWGLSESDVRCITRTSDLYSHLPTESIKKVIYESHLRYLLGRNVFPDEQIMKEYYGLLHQQIMGLINTFDVDNLAKDPASIYLTGQLIGRGNRYKIPC